MTTPHDARLDRRTLLRAGLGAAAAAALPRPLRAHGSTAERPAARTYLEAARRAERWIRAARIPTEHGAAWPADPRDPATASLDLYNGWPGVVLFYLELHAATGDATALAEARAGADELLARLAQDEAIRDAGLYAGLAGHAFVLAEAHAATGDARYRAGALRVLELLERRAQAVGDGAQWSEVTDVIAGGAGVGLALLDLHRRYGERRALALAERAGRRLAALGIPDGADVKWAMAPDFPRQMPNFSHGTAGVAYFLATLAAATGDRAALEAAQRGARYLQRVATCDGAPGGEGCAVFHHTGGGEALFYLGWCHGPAGTARLFHRLARQTGDRAHAEWVGRGARAIVRSGIPERRTPGFWNNVSVCCGDAGVADFFLQLHRLDGDATALAFARRLAADVLRRGTDDAAGLRWVQAEHRVRPELLVAQAGYMQGAAGVGSVLLRLDALEQRRAVRVRWPDSPWQ